MAEKTLVMSSAAEFVLLQLALPGKPVETIGVLLLEASGQVHYKLRDDWEQIPDADVEVLEQLDADFAKWIEEKGGPEFLRYLEDAASNTIAISERREARITTVPQTLRQLFAKYVRPLEVLPLYSLRAAATKFGQDLEVETEPDEWIEAPDGLRVSPDLFVARVVGRSMEPLIADGSLCVFRHGVVGSRQGKRLLVQVEGASSSGGEFTVKRYVSVKRQTPEGWEHAEVRLEPLNPEFDPMVFGPDDEQRRFRVIGEFVQVVD